MGQWWAKWESASSTFVSQLVWGLCASGLISPRCWGFQDLHSSSEILLCVSLEGEQGPCPKAALLFLKAPLCIPSFPSLANVWTCHSGKVLEAKWSLFPIIKKCKLLCPGDPQGSCWISLVVTLSASVFYFTYLGIYNPLWRRNKLHHRKKLKSLETQVIANLRWNLGWSTTFKS